MAVPTPQTPSALYGIVPVMVDPIFVELRGNIFITIKGALSRAFIDLPYYDGGNYRDTVDSSFLGRAPLSPLVQTGLTANDPFNGDILLADGPTVPLDDAILTTMKQDDNFTHVLPHPEMHARTMIMWFSIAGATGNVVGSCWQDRYIAESHNIPQSNGGVPPVFTP